MHKRRRKNPSLKRPGRPVRPEEKIRQQMLRHNPAHAQVDFGKALAAIAGVERKIHFFAMDLRRSDACFVQAYPRDRRSLL